MKKRVFMAVFLAACMTVGVCGCSSADEKDVFTGDTPEVPEWQENLDAISPAVYADISELDLEPGTYISVIGKTENSSYWQQVAAGVQQAADDINEKLGYSGSDAVRVLFNAPADSEDIDEQVNILDEEMARYPDVIAIASIDENASEVQFDLAIANGIPIVAFDSGNSYQGIQCTCMTNNTEAAAMGAQKLCEAIGESGEVALIVPDSVSGNAKDRVSAFQQEISENHPGVSIAETIYMDQLDELKREAAAEQLGVSAEELAAWTAEAAGEQTAIEEAETVADGTDGDEDTSENISEEARTRLEDIDSIAGGMSDEDAIVYYLEKHPDLKGCFGTNDETVLLGAQALKSMEKTEDIVMMGFDAGKDQLSALSDGSIDGLVVQNPFGMGYATVVAAARTALEIGNEAQVDTGFVWVDAENMEDESIQPMLYE
ncbi:substrate-binding domain-containing protein [Mediterraneibacter glycyrrhizinilyticus]|uniref:substrate-binding domain-containing protein n=1 Tax=Mediterraneibacter glycyrrhizinilyticus TaxID=342942 RepID=UPI0025A4C956|nr:substrate-binding domain-containing protein [Mediterraneibacter glycyrrhizinilyticus]MDM8211150.1 substrate-binding domain-containing protein [Mediterraneibacter glycyrrhizinilyticus]